MLCHLNELLQNSLHCTTSVPTYTIASQEDFAQKYSPEKIHKSLELSWRDRHHSSKIDSLKLYIVDCCGEWHLSCCSESTTGIQVGWDLVTVKALAKKIYIVYQMDGLERAHSNQNSNVSSLSGVEDMIPTFTPCALKGLSPGTLVSCPNPVTCTVV